MSADSPHLQTLPEPGSKPSYTVALLSWAGHENYGDTLLARDLPKALVNASAGKAQVRVYSDSASIEDDCTNGITDLSWTDADIIAIGGGGLVTPDFWAFQFNLWPLLFGKKIVFLNVNVTEELTGDESFLKKIKAMGATWWVRDGASHALLAKSDIAAFLLPDVSFASLTSAAKSKMVGDEGDRVLTVVPNAYVFYDLVGDNAKLAMRAHVVLKEMASYLDWMITFGWKVQILPLQTSRGGDDRFPSSALYAAMRSRVSSRWVSEPQTFEQITGKLQSSDLVVSMRYHATTVSIAAGVPCVTILFHDKSKGLLTDIGLIDQTVIYEALTVLELIRATQAAENTDVYGEQIDRYRDEARCCWETDFKEQWQSYVNNNPVTKGDAR